MLFENLFFSNHVSRTDAFHPIMPLITIRPKNKIPAVPVKAGKKTTDFQVFQPNSEKGSFSSFSSRSGHPDC